MKTALINFREKHGRWIPVLFFMFGFIFDALFLNRIDELATVLQQAVYLLISAGLIGFDILKQQNQIVLPLWFSKVWKYREELLHFLLGTLLNSYTIFYFKSASSITSFLFMAILVGLLMINEFKRFKQNQIQVHCALWSLCLVSYFASLAPILIGSLGVLPFMLGMLTAALIVFAFYRILLRFGNIEQLRTQLVLPFSAVMGLFCVLYFAHAIPPVPLSVSYMGIYHDVSKREGHYELAYSRPSWKFWQHGDQSYLYRPGDSVFCFARIFSPTRFNESLHINWYFQSEKRGWLLADSVPLSITGGREEGFRGFAKKSNIQMGQWQVRIETDDDREIGRIAFEVIPDGDTEPRTYSLTQQ